MTRRRLAVAALLTAGTLVPTPATAQASAEGAFVLLLGGDTLAVENFTRGPGTASGTLTGPTVGRLAFQADLTADEGIGAIRLQAWPAGQSMDAPPAQDASLTMRGDTAVFSAVGPRGDSMSQRIPTTAGAIPYLNPSFLLIEQILRRARVVGGDTVTVPLFMLQGGTTIPAMVAWHASDSATLTIGGSAFQATLTEDGRLLSAAVPAQNLVVERVDGAHLASVTIAPPDYSAPEGAPYSAEDVEVPTPAGHVLAGTLTRPRSEGAVPAVLFITGSGAQDRDSALPMLHGFRPFREFADSLSRRGIAVLRLDDRGFGASGGEFANATSADFADDARAALEFLRGRTGIDAQRLGVVGHSEGGMIAPMLAATDPDLSAMVLIAGPARSGREIIRYQQRQAIEGMPGLAPAEQDSMIADARAELERLAHHQPWLAFFLDYEPLQTARLITETPVLILQGDTDRQVTADQADILGSAFRDAGNPDVTVRRFPDINHLMLHDPDGDPAGYATLEARQIDRGLLGTLADWLADRLR